MYVRMYMCTRAPRATPSRGYSRQLASAARVSTYVPLLLPLSSYSNPFYLPIPRFSSILFPRVIDATPSFSISLRVCVRLYMCDSASISFHSCALVTHGHRRIRAGFARGTVAVGRRGGLHGRRVMIFRAHYEIFEMICRDCAF